jgi:hypothetical protein
MAPSWEANQTDGERTPTTRCPVSFCDERVVQSRRFRGTLVTESTEVESIMRNVLGLLKQQAKLIAYKAGVVPVPYGMHLAQKRDVVLGAAAARLAQHHIAGDASPFERAFIEFALGMWDQGWSQFSQDKFVLFCLEEPRGGTFVEFGGADGLTHSNSALLESGYGWHGLLLEPNPFEFPLLRRNRPGCRALNAAVKCSDADEMDLVICGQLSTVRGFEPADKHSAARSTSGILRRVRCVDLNEAIVAAGFGSETLDYLSVDSEGSELAILRRFNFERGPRILTLECNERAADEAAIRSVMAANGYRETMSQRLTAPDLWFVREDVYDAMGRRSLSSRG